MNTTKFADLKLIAPLQLALKESGYETPTPIQLQAIPLVLEGHDLLGIAQTGTGKTAAFSLPILQLLHERRNAREPKSPRALILTPTRELAIQIHKSLETYGKHMHQKHVVVFGGVAQGKQVREMAQGADVLVATPGRLLDLIQQRLIKLDRVEIFVLDEADRMLDMGFIRDIKKLLPLLPKKKHSLFFSATMPSEIQKLAEEILHSPKKIEVTPESTTVEKIQQSVMYVEKKDKMNLLIHLLKNNKLNKVLVFVEMKHIANKVVEGLQQNRITAAAIHGNKSQGARQRAIEDFTKDRARVLVATDIASRGIDIDGITHVINFELPNIPESYVHRIGRTARAGSNGDAISLVTSEEKAYLNAIERSTRQRIDVDIDQPYHSEAAARSVGVRPPPRAQGRGGGGGRRPSGGGGRPSSRSGSSRPRR
ncbi:MAG: DEAD/DEAH box helicase [Bdellovibrionaceae bacterium]|nr:DEAD/DEAH box helicase [Pseudobdellovibrionaceae bacterium]